MMRVGDQAIWHGYTWRIMAIHHTHITVSAVDLMRRSQGTIQWATVPISDIELGKDNGKNTDD